MNDTKIKAKIFIILDDDDLDKSENVYFGITTGKLNSRISSFRKFFKNYKQNSNMNGYYSFYKIFEKRLFPIYYTVEEVFDTKMNLYKKFNEYITTSKKCVNERIIGDYSEEHFMNMKEKIKQSQKEYYKKNVNKLKQKAKEHYEKNKEVKLLKMKVKRLEKKVNDLSNPNNEEAKKLSEKIKKLI